MLKSYAPDLHYAERFIESFKRYAIEAIPLYVVVPDEDMTDFELVVGETGTVLPESLWAEQLVDYPIHGNNPGYINQEIIKLAFAEKGFLGNYLCADSEAVFIRSFGVSDFMDPSGVPYSFITEDHELHVDPNYYTKYWEARDRWLRGLRLFLNLPETPYSTCHGFGVFSSESVTQLVSFLRDRGMAIADALQLCPYEFSWYNFWIERELGDQRIVREPIFKTLHIKGQYLQLALQKVSTADIARGYVGLVVNSGFSRESVFADLESPMETVLAQYVSYGNLVGAMFERLFVKAPRVRRLLGSPRH